MEKTNNNSPGKPSNIATELQELANKMAHNHRMLENTDVMISALFGTPHEPLPNMDIEKTSLLGMISSLNTKMQILNDELERINIIMHNFIGLDGEKNTIPR